MTKGQIKNCIKHNEKQRKYHLDKIAEECSALQEELNDRDNQYLACKIYSTFARMQDSFENAREAELIMNTLTNIIQAEEFKK